MQPPKERLDIDKPFAETTGQILGINNTPQPQKGEAKGRRKLCEKKHTPILANIADQHNMTVGTVEDYVEYRLNSGGIKNPTAFEKHLLGNLAKLYSDESVQLEEWFNIFETQRTIIDYLVNEFLSMHWFDRPKCQEQAKDDVLLKKKNIVPSAVLIEIAFQTAKSKRREQIVGVA